MHSQFIQNAILNSISTGKQMQIIRLHPLWVIKTKLLSYRPRPSCNVETALIQIIGRIPPHLVWIKASWLLAHSFSKCLTDHRKFQALKQAGVEANDNLSCRVNINWYNYETLDTAIFCATFSPAYDCKLWIGVYRGDKKLGAIELPACSIFQNHSPSRKQLNSNVLDRDSLLRVLKNVIIEYIMSDQNYSKVEFYLFFKQIRHIQHFDVVLLYST